MLWLLSCSAASLFTAYFPEALPVLESCYGKPNKTIHASSVFCLGDEDAIIECSLTLHALDDDREQLQNADVAGVSCVLSQMSLWD